MSALTVPGAVGTVPRHDVRTHHMCKSVRQGGQRCAAHTRAAYQRALNGSDQDTLRSTAVAYGSTTEGRGVLLREMHQHIEQERFEDAARVNSYIAAGDSLRAANSESAIAIAEAEARTLGGRPVLGIDLDGTIAMGYNEAVHTELVRMGVLGPDSVCDPRTYDIADAFGLDRVIVNEAITRLSAAGNTYRYAPPDREGIEVINALAKDGAYVKVVTARSAEHGGVPTLEWLALKSGLTFHEVVYTHDKSTVHFDLLADDAPYNVVNLLEHNRKAVLKDRTWNRDVDLPRMGSWSELGDHLAAARA